MLPGNADRYTILNKPASELANVVKACAQLGLVWFATTVEGSRYECEIHIFFDHQGMKNYMNGLYASEKD